MRRLLLCSAIAATTLGLAEWAARAHEARPPLPDAADRAVPFGMYRSDADAGVALARHVWIPSESFATNTFGHRDRPREAGKPAPWTTRVAVVGGSNGAGRGVSDPHTFARLLEDATKSAVDSPEDGRLPPGLEVWNLAVPGYGAEQALLRLEADWETVHPDVVLFAFDLADTPIRTLFGPGGRRVVGGELLSGPWTPFPSAPYEDERATILRAGLEIGPLRLSSALQRAAGRTVAGGLLQIPPGMAPFEARAFGGWAWLWMAPAPDPVDVAWSLVDDSLARLVAACADRGAQLALLALPGRIDLDPAAFAAAEASAARLATEGAPTFEPGTPLARLASLAEELSVPLLDPTAALRDAGEPVHYLDVPELNAAGHRSIAEFLAASTDLRMPPHDDEILRETLHTAVPPHSAETAFDGGFRPARGGRESVVRWERSVHWAW